jgi:hypothetical protein
MIIIALCLSLITEGVIIQKGFEYIAKAIIYAADCYEKKGSR